MFDAVRELSSPQLNLPRVGLSANCPVTDETLLVKNTFRAQSPRCSV